MATGIPARLTGAEGRKFGLTVGGAFLLLAALLWWREHPIGMAVTGGLGSLFIAGALILPSRLGPVYRAWMGLALVLSKITTPIFLGIVYFGMFASFGWVMRRVGRDPLGSPARGASAWHTRESGHRKSALDHQF